MFSRKVITGLVFTSLLSGCSLVKGSGPKSVATVNPTLVIDLFAARGFLGGSDYEQYKLVKGVMWRECGSVSSSKKPTTKKPDSSEGDQVFKRDPSLVPAQRRVEDLSATQQGSLAQLVAELLRIEDSNIHRLPPPGSIFLLADPGLIELSVEIDGKKKRIITSVDAVADGDSPGAKTARELIKNLRGVGPVICNARTFFGIPRAEE